MVFNVLLISAGQQSDSVIHIYMYIHIYIHIHTFFGKDAEIVGHPFANKQKKHKHFDLYLVSHAKVTQNGY